MKGKKRGLKKLGVFDKLQGPIGNKNGMKAKQLGVPISFYEGDTSVAHGGVGHGQVQQTWTTGLTRIPLGFCFF